MPDSKISALPSASALAGTELVPVFQSGNTVQTTTSAIAALASGGVTDGDKGDITVSSSATVWTIDPAAVSNSKLADVATATFKGRTTAGTGSPEDLTATQATAILDTFTSSAKGLVPASGGGTTTFLRADGSFAAPSGSSPTTTKGDLIVRSASADSRLPVSITNGDILTVDSAESLGVKWAPVPNTVTTAALGDTSTLIANTEFVSLSALKKLGTAGASGGVGIPGNAGAFLSIGPAARLVTGNGGASSVGNGGNGGNARIGLAIMGGNGGVGSSSAAVSGGTGGAASAGIYAIRIAGGNGGAGDVFAGGNGGAGGTITMTGGNGQPGATAIGANGGGAGSINTSASETLAGGSILTNAGFDRAGGSIDISNSGIIIKSGTGSPEGVVTASTGSFFLRIDGGSGATVYVKESGTGNTGWVAYSSSGGGTGGNHGFIFGEPGGPLLTVGLSKENPAIPAGTFTGFNLLVDAGTITIQFQKASTSGGVVGTYATVFTATISSGRFTSGDTTGWASTSRAAGDVFKANITAASGVREATLTLF